MQTTINEEFEKAMEKAISAGRELELAPEQEPDDVKCARVFGETGPYGGDDDWVVACSVVHRNPEGGPAADLLTTSARNKFYGGVIVGPSTRDRPGTMDDLKRMICPNHWVFNPGVAVMRDGTTVTTTSPSLVPTHRVRSVCGQCGKVVEEWREAVMVRAGRRQALKCAACGTELQPQRVLTTVTQMVGDELAVKIADSMLEGWRAGLPKSRISAIVTPRLWAAYTAGNAPVAPDEWNWDMADARARTMIERAAMYKASDGSANPLDILPWSVAKRHNGLSGEHAPVAIWVEIPDGCRTGWVRLSSLRLLASAGWTCRMTSVTSPLIPPTNKTRQTRRVPAPRPVELVVI